MDAGVESAESGRVNGIAMEIPAIETASSLSPPPRLPKRLRERLLDCKTPPSLTVEQIQAKLRVADLRRQQFYEKLSIKARPKPRSPSQLVSNEEDLGQRLEAKLQAAEQKRLSILSKAQMRLAKLDELRQAAKTGVAMRVEKEREELGTKVESRVQQAEANRMLILKAYRQRRATLKERTSQSLLRRMARESKHKERVRAAIQQKRSAAEKKRLGLLEAEKKRVRARVLQVRWVAKSVSHQREIERRRMKDQLEDRLQRAKRQRAEYLRQRGRRHSSVRVTCYRMHNQADLLSRKLARCWRRFLKQRRTTLDLAKAYDALHINEKYVKSMPFEQLALLIESTATLKTVKALLDRFESRFKVFQSIAASSNPSSWDDIDHLLKRVASPNKRAAPKNSPRSRDARKVGSIRELARSPVKLSRYQVRVVLCAYMILSHPDAVFSEQGEREIALAKSAGNFAREWELLMKIILEGPIQSSDEESDNSLPRRWTFRSQLAAFDKAWCSYLNCFVVWKVKDARSLEEDLVRAACQLELSMIQTCKLTPEGDSVVLTHDMKAIQKQVTEDQKLLREKVQHLSGNAGIERMECALSDTRTKYFRARENGSPLGSPITQFLSPNQLYPSAGSPAVASSEQRSTLMESSARQCHVVRSLFREDDASMPKKVGSSTPRSSLGGPLGSVGEQLITENELIVNEVVHEQHHTSADSLNISDDEQNVIKMKIRETMEKAFWDGITESMKQDEPNYGRIVELIREVRDELCEMAPQNWKQEIVEAIDLDILSKLLKSGVLDMEYLGKILEFALVTLQKLSAPANDDELKANCDKLLKELAEICHNTEESNYLHVIALIKGLRFILEQIQVLKQDISKARVRLMEPLLKGPAGLDYLRNAFASRYGPPSDALSSLPLTVQWLASLWDCKDQEWGEHKNSLSLLTSHERSSQIFPITTLRTGGPLLVKASGSQVTASKNATGNHQPQCDGESVDLLVKLGLLKLVCRVSGLIQQDLPETLMLNLSRLRAVQAHIQKIIVLSTTNLICRQTLLAEQLVSSPTEMESIVSKYTEQLSEFLDHVSDAGIEEIVEIISGFLKDCDKSVDTEKLQSRKVIMARMLAKSLQAEDAVFKRVSHAVYLAARGVVLGGSGLHGRKLAEMALQQVGAISLTGRVVEAAELLVVAATVSVSVHGPWYTHLTNSIW